MAKRRAVPSERLAIQRSSGLGPSSGSLRLPVPSHQARHRDSAPEHADLLVSERELREEPRHATLWGAQPGEPKLEPIANRELDPTPKP
jgi:hypothetical protein